MLEKPISILLGFSNIPTVSAVYLEAEGLESSEGRRP